MISTNVPFVNVMQITDHWERLVEEPRTPANALALAFGEFTIATGINDSRQIVGVYNDVDF